MTGGNGEFQPAERVRQGFLSPHQTVFLSQHHIGVLPVGIDQQPLQLRNRFPQHFRQFLLVVYAVSVYHRTGHHAAVRGLAQVQMAQLAPMGGFVIDRFRIAQRPFSKCRCRPGEGFRLQ